MPPRKILPTQRYIRRTWRNHQTETALHRFCRKIPMSRLPPESLIRPAPRKGLKIHRERTMPALEQQGEDPIRFAPEEMIPAEYVRVRAENLYPFAQEERPPSHEGHLRAVIVIVPVMLQMIRSQTMHDTRGIAVEKSEEFIDIGNEAIVILRVNDVVPRMECREVATVCHDITGARNHTNISILYQDPCMGIVIPDDDVIDEGKRAQVPHNRADVARTLPRDEAGRNAGEG